MHRCRSTPPQPLSRAALPAALDKAAASGLQDSSLDWTGPQPEPPDPFFLLSFSTGETANLPNWRWRVPVSLAGAHQSLLSVHALLGSLTIEEGGDVKTEEICVETGWTPSAWAALPGPLRCRVTLLGMVAPYERSSECGEPKGSGSKQGQAGAGAGTGRGPKEQGQMGTRAGMRASGPSAPCPGMGPNLPGQHRLAPGTCVPWASPSWAAEGILGSIQTMRPLQASTQGAPPASDLSSASPGASAHQGTHGVGGPEAILASVSACLPLSARRPRIPPWTPTYRGVRPPGRTLAPSRGQRRPSLSQAGCQGGSTVVYLVVCMRCVCAHSPSHES